MPGEDTSVEGATPFARILRAVDETPDPLIGAVIDGRWRVVERLGQGGMGTVYRAIDETLHREVAIKVLNAELNDPSVARRFRAEAVTVTRLNHPGIATVYELFQHEGQWLMVMEFVRGETLEALVSRKGPLPHAEAVDLCMQALAALKPRALARDLEPLRRALHERDFVRGAAQHARDRRPRFVPHPPVLDVHVEGVRAGAVREQRVVAIESRARHVGQDADSSPIEVREPGVESREARAQARRRSGLHASPDTIPG